MYSSCFVVFVLVKCFLNRNFIINHKSHFVGLRVLKLILFVLLCEPYVMKKIFVVHRLDQMPSWTWSVVLPETIYNKNRPNDFTSCIENWYYVHCAYTYLFERNSMFAVSMLNRFIQEMGEYWQFTIDISFIDLLKSVP